jgi:hypothetical protein
MRKRERGIAPKGEKQMNTVDPYSNTTALRTAAQYKAALEKVSLSSLERAMLVAQLNAPEHTISPAQLARELKIGSRRSKNAAAPINAMYGRLAGRIARALGYTTKAPVRTARCPHSWFVLSTWNPQAKCDGSPNQWIMRPELVAALR